MAHNLDESQQEETSSSARDCQQIRRQSQPLSRRSYIKFGAVVGSTFSATGAEARQSSIERDGITFRRVQHAVDDLGVDPGGAVVDGALESIENETLVQFPAGTYRFDSVDNETLGGKTVGFEALDGGVQFRPSEGKPRFLLDGTSVKEAYVSGIEIDQRETGPAAGIRLHGGRVVLDDIRSVGGSTRRRGGIAIFSVSSLSETGRVILRGISVSETASSRPVRGRPGVYVDPSNRGIVLIEESEFRGLPDQAIHGTNHSGTVQIDDSYFENNAAAIRLGGAGSRVRDCKIHTTELPPGRSLREDNRFHRHGIAIADEQFSSTKSTDPIIIEDTDIEIGKVDTPYPAVLSLGGAEPIEIRDSKIRHQNDSIAVISAFQHDSTGTVPTRQLLLEETTVVSEGKTEAVIESGHAYQCRINQSTLTSSNRSGNGIRLLDPTAVTIDRTTVDVPQKAVFSDAVGTASERQAGDGKRVLRIRSPHRGTNYEITTSGSVSPTTESHSENISGASIEGTARSAVTGFEFRGKITDLRFDGAATLTLERQVTGY